MLCFDPFNKDIDKIATLSTVLLYFALYPKLCSLYINASKLLTLFYKDTTFLRRCQVFFNL